MKKAKEKLTAILNAVTFAEAGEHETAMQYLESAEQHVPGEPTPTDASLHEARGDDTDLMRTAENHKVSADFAEPGESQTAVELTGGTRHAHSVLVVIGGNEFEPQPGAFTYAMNLCTRIDADLELLVLSENSVDAGPQAKSFTTKVLSERVAGACRLARELGVGCTVVFEQGDFHQRLIDHMREHKEIAALIIGSRGDRTSSTGADLLRALENQANRLSIPLVRVLGRRLVPKTA